MFGFASHTVDTGVPMYSNRLFFSESANWIKPSYTVAVGWHLLVERRRHLPLVKCGSLQSLMPVQAVLWSFCTSS